MTYRDGTKGGEYPSQKGDLISNPICSKERASKMYLLGGVERGVVGWGCLEVVEINRSLSWSKMMPMRPS